MDLSLMEPINLTKDCLWDDARDAFVALTSRPYGKCPSKHLLIQGQQ